MANSNTLTPGKDQTVLFVLLMAMVFSLSPLAIDMYLPAMPTMAAHFGSSIDAMEASVAVFLFGFALGQFFFGAISDSFDKSRLMILGLLGFAIASYFVAQSDTTTKLYLWRALQAFSSGSSVVVFAMIQQRYKTDADGGAANSSKVISYIMSAVVIAPMIAPMVGGQILKNFSWQMIFYVLSAYAIITFVVIQIFQTGSKKILPESIKKPLQISNLLKAYKHIFSNTTTLAYIFAGGFSFAGLFAFVSGSPFVYMEYFNASPDEFAGLVAINAIAMIGMNLINAKVFGHVDPTKKLIFGGFLIFVISIYLMVVAYLDLGLVFVVTGVVMYVGCLGLTASNAMAGALVSAKEYAGMLSGINGVLQFGIGAAASTLVSVSASTSPMTMNVAMAVSGILCFTFVLVLMKKPLLILNDSGLTTAKEI